MDKHRCDWCGNDQLYMKYHDEEWGIPVHDDRTLFEFVLLDGAQAGLSWITILRKRENYRRALDDFDAQKIACYGDTKIAELMADAGIIRNRQKINSAIKNAKAYLAVQEAFGSFDRYLWQFVDGRTIQNSWRTMADIPAFTPESTAMSKDMKKRGFSFVGPTICYAFMQSAGMVNDHITSCFRYAELGGKG